MLRKPAPITMFIALTCALALALVGLSVARAQGTEPTVQMGGNDELGSFLVGPDGMTLYLFTNDTPGVSNCSGDCLVNWPPLLVDEGVQPTLAEGIPGRLGVIQRADDSTYQVVYNGMPLYYWKDDAQAGDATGQGVGDVWYVIKPADVSLGGNDELGSFLVGPNGMTLYLFTNDTPGTSNCYDDCAVKWPPLLVPDGQQPSAGDGVTGMLGVTERTDGTYQVTYNDTPLYYWFKDIVPGDATGQNVGEVWFVIDPNAMMAPEATPAMDDSSMSSALDGEELVSTRCTVCHSRDRIDAATKDRAGWEATVDRMIGHGAQLNDEERLAVIDYLSNR